MRWLLVLAALAGCDRVFGLGDPYEDAPLQPGDVTGGRDVGSTDDSGSGGRKATLIAWYKLDNDFTDAVGTADGLCSRTSGQLCTFGTTRSGSGESADFPGDMCVAMPTFAARPTEVSISLWLQTGNGGTTTLISRPYAPTAPPPFSWNLQEDFDSLQWMTYGNGTPNTLAEAPGINTVGWHHIAVTASASAQVIYLDGAALGGTGGSGVSYDADAVYLGCDSGSAVVGKFVGLLDDVKIFDGVLTPSDVLTLSTQ